MKKAQYARFSIGGQLIPPMVYVETARQRANVIGRAIYSLAGRNAPLVRHIVSTFAAASNSDKQIVISQLNDPEGEWNQRTLHYARQFVCFPFSLGVHDLGIRLLTCRDDPAYIQTILANLKLPEDTPRRVNKPRSQAKSARSQIAIEVVRPVGAGKVGTDGASSATMVLAAVVEAWRFAVPPDLSSGKPSDRSTGAVPKPPDIHPWSYLPPAVLLGPTFGGTEKRMKKLTIREVLMTHIVSKHPSYAGY